MLTVTVLEDSGHVAADTGHRQVLGVSMGSADYWQEHCDAAVVLHNAAVLHNPAAKHAQKYKYKLLQNYMTACQQPLFYKLKYGI